MSLMAIAVARDENGAGISGYLTHVTLNRVGLVEG